MKLMHHIAADPPQIYNDLLTNYMYRVLIGTAWAHPYVLSALRSENI